ncbi:hypothetical protein EN12_20480 [Vibrio cholerae]|uniref:Uncharacterized protein n=1 Tax=Vibrio cholerae TaxID=666 RepID=A0A5B1C3N8_VIBCL|nr:hypothetical protein [Vibrio cholerae]AKO77548.1 hypothetical protein EN12_20480 [Vibrio cholerae]KAA1255256.1 hypothetical protein F0M16_08550 [Vibrio cholerae]
MCNQIRLNSQAIKTLKSKTVRPETSLNQQIITTHTKFARTSFKLNSDKVVIISNDFQKSCKLTSLFIHKILTLRDIETLDSVIYLNRFVGDHIIIDFDQLNHLLTHIKSGTSLPKYKKVYIIADKDICDKRIYDASILLRNPNETQNVILCHLDSESETIKTDETSNSFSMLETTTSTSTDSLEDNDNVLIINNNKNTKNEKPALVTDSSSEYVEGIPSFL